MRRTVDNQGLVTINEANNKYQGLLDALHQARSDLATSRHVITQLFWRDFIAQFRQKLLGYLWALLTPLLGIANFLFLYYIGVLSPGEGQTPFALYVLLGSSIWGCLPSAMGAVSAGLQNQAELIMRTNIPKIALAVSSLAGVIYSILVGMITILVAFLAFGIQPTWWLALYPILVLPMILLGASLGLLLSVLGIVARDLTQLTTQVISLLMYVTPIVYLRSTVSNPAVKLIIEWNPLTYLVDTPRSLVTHGAASQAIVYLMVYILTFVFVLFSIRFFYLLEDLVAERL